jgi:hypothetical protein
VGEAEQAREDDVLGDCSIIPPLASTRITARFEVEAPVTMAVGHFVGDALLALGAQPVGGQRHFGAVPMSVTA